MPAVVVNNTVFGSNINTLGDSGSFEALAASWGATFNSPSYHTVTRSSTVAYAGTYSARVQALSTSFNDPIINNVASHTISGFKKYVASCYIYMPSVTPFVSDGLPFFFLTREGNGTSTISEGGASMASITDQWSRLEIKYQSSSASSSTCNIKLNVINGAINGSGSPSNPIFSTINYNGLLYIDNFEIKEYTDTPVNFQVDTVIVPRRGPNDTIGSITINVTPPGSYLYSITDLAGLAAGNSFTSLGGIYTVYVDFQIVASNYYNYLVDVYSIGPQFNISAVGTNETSAGASDGTITVSVSSAFGAPYIYSIYLQSGLVASNGTGIFTSLDPGTYLYQVVDTFGNALSASIIIGETLCALIFNSSLTVVTKSTTPTTADGQIQVVANDPTFGGAYQYNLGSDFTYGSGTNTTGLFTGLLPGAYTIYARTSLVCGNSINVTVGSSSLTYGVKYRLTFSQLAVERFYKSNGFLSDYGIRPQFRLDILERSYAGAITEVKSTEVPVKYSWRGEGEQDPFKLTVVPLDIEVNLLSVTPQQFIELYTSDETKYKFQFYQYNYDTSDTLLCQGFGVSQLYSEEYGQINNYPVVFRATDRLADLSKFEFTDNNGNRPSGRISVLSAISFCLNKTGLEMDIRDKVNVYAPGMAITQSDGALTQRYFDVEVYRNDDGSMKDCREVLEGLLKGCSLFQSEGIWHVETVSEKCASVTYYQQYDFLGNYVSSGVENNRLKIRPNTGTSPKLMFSDSSQQLRIAEGYGSVDITYDLGIEKENNLLTYGKFEGVDLTTGQLKGWTATFATPVEVVLERSPSRNTTDTCLSIRFDPYTASSDVTLSADPVQITLLNGKTNRLKLTFDVYTRPFNTQAYIYIDYRLRITGTASGDFYLQKTPNATRGIPQMLVSTSDLMTDGYIRQYLDNNLQWQTISVECFIADPGVDLTGLLKLDFKVSGNPVFDADSLDQAALVALDASTTPIRKINNRRKVQQTANFCSQYTLEPGTEATSVPTIIRPTTYTNHVWKLKNSMNVETSQDLWVQHILMDNVRVEYLPSEVAPVTKLSSIGVIDANMAPVFEDTLLHGDIFYSSLYALTNELDPNYEKLMKGHYTLSSGFAIYGGWFRRGVNENKFYHELYNKMVRGQFALPRWLLSGSWDTREVLPSFANIFFEPTSARVFMPMSLSVDPKNMITEFEIRESLKGDVTDPDYVPEPVDNPDNNFEQFSDEFSDEFA